MYHGSGRDREASPPRSLRRVLALAALAAALQAGGCSISMPLGPVLADQEIATGSIDGDPVSPLSPDLGAEDWRRARAALAVALDPQGTGAAVNWDNPDSGRKGSFASVGQPFVRDDAVCRAFLATLHRPEATASLQGTACRPSGGEWVIREVKPFRRPA